MTLSIAPFESRMRILPQRKQAWPFVISNIVVHAKSYSRSHGAVIRVYDDAGNVIKTHEARGRGEVLTCSVLIAQLCFTSISAFPYDPI